MRNLGWSKYMSPTESRRALPTLADPNPGGRALKGSVSRLLLAVLLWVLLVLEALRCRGADG